MKAAAAWAGFAAMSVGMFMAILDVQVVATSLPTIGAALAIARQGVSWIQTAYLIAEVIAIPLTGLMIRVLGMRRLFVIAISLFTLASVGCASSTSLGELVAMRVLQGAGGAMMVPVGRNMVLSTAAKEDILRLTSYVVWPGLLAPVVAPLRLRSDLGGIALDGTAVAADRRIHLIGYGPSQSTVGANRAGRAAATAVSQLLRSGG